MLPGLYKKTTVSEWLLCLVDLLPLAIRWVKVLRLHPGTACCCLDNVLNLYCDMPTCQSYFSRWLFSCI